MYSMKFMQITTKRIKSTERMKCTDGNKVSNNIVGNFLSQSFLLRDSMPFITYEREYLFLRLLFIH